MRSFTLLLLLAAFTAAPARGAPRPALVGAGAEVSAAPGPDRLVAAATIVEPADADASGGAMALPVRIAAASPASAPVPGRCFLGADGSVSDLPRSHLLERASHPSTAPPFLNA